MAPRRAISRDGRIDTSRYAAVPASHERSLAEAMMSLVNAIQARALFLGIIGVSAD